MSIESLNAFSMDFFSLKGKTAIVTGGNSGLGQAFAMALAKAGANIFIPSFVKDNGETKEMIEKQGVEVDFMQVISPQKARRRRLSLLAVSVSVQLIFWLTMPVFVS
ncbi:hypothetical protein VEE67_09330 [Escherichia coli]|nr:hypothetical protein VEGS11_09370 [Escherichia coli]BEC13341.1 hypothetical protein VEE67_09330 [Escherichia coli]